MQTDKEMEFIEKKMKNKTGLYQMLYDEDPHCIRLVHWIASMQDIITEALESDMDRELADELCKVSGRLMRELGFRISMMLP